jgi:hypothetical protein
VHVLAGERIARGDLDRLVEHRLDPERVDRTHRLSLVAVREAHAVPGRTAGERVGDGDLTVTAQVNEVLARERWETPQGVMGAATIFLQNRNLVGPFVDDFRSTFKPTQVNEVRESRCRSFAPWPSQSAEEGKHGLSLV